jgi:hypothetical protein
MGMCSLRNRQQKEKSFCGKATVELPVFSVALVFDLFIFSSPVHLRGLVPVSTAGTARTYVRFGLVV